MPFILPVGEYTARVQNFYVEDMGQRIDCVQTNIIKVYSKSLHLVVAKPRMKLSVHS